MLLEA